MKLMTFIEILCVLTGGGISGLLIKKNKGLTSLFKKVLGSYEMIASFVGVGLGIYVTTIMAGSPITKIFFLALFLALGGLGIAGGWKLISGGSDRLSLWWGLAQLPVVFLNLHWLVFKYYAAFLFGIPLAFIFRVGDKIQFLFDFKFHIFSAFLEVSAYLKFPGRGFGIGLGLNLVAAFFLGLLLLSRRSKTP